MPAGKEATMSINRVESSGSAITMMETQDAMAADLGGDVNAEVAAMVLISGRDAKNVARTERSAEEDMIAAQQEQQIQKLRDQADEIRTAGWQRGVGMMIA